MDTPTDPTPVPDAADELDETVTTRDGDGEKVTSKYPPSRPMGVEDPAIVQGDAEIRDDMVTREWREEPEEKPEPGAEESS